MGVYEKKCWVNSGSALTFSKVLSAVTLYSHFDRALTFKNFVLAKLLWWTPASAALVVLQTF